MTKSKTTRKALIASALSLLMCVSMLVGTTFAWFTDSVTSAGNIIKAGNLDVEMSWAEGKADPAAKGTAWTDASEGAIFNYDLWEPGYTEVRHIKIDNVGSLALKYQVNIVATGTVSELADVIDVYFIDPAVQVANRTDLSEDDKVGTLSDVLAGITKGDVSTSGHLLAGKSATVTIALKMQETAGNEYMKLSIGSSFKIQLIATQYAYEKDSFDDQYDADAKYGTDDDAEADDAITVTPENISEITFNENGTYKFQGDFTGETTITVANTTSNVTLDGSDATFKNHVEVTFKRIADHASELVEARSGAYTVKNFTVENSLSIGACGVESLTVSGCEVGAMDFNASNCKVILEGNMVTVTEQHKIYNGKLSAEYAVYLYADHYDLVMNGNTFTNTVSEERAVGIQGNYDQFQKGEITWKNSIRATGNTMTCYQKTLFKIWDDVTYAPVEWPENYRITDEAKALARQLYDPEVNTTNTDEGFGVFEIPCRAANNQPDLRATELNFDELKAIWHEFHS